MRCEVRTCRSWPAYRRVRAGGRGAGGVWGEVVGLAGGESDGASSVAALMHRIGAICRLFTSPFQLGTHCVPNRARTHYRPLLRVERDRRGNWYHGGMGANQNRSSRALERHVGRLVFERLLLSRDKAARQSKKRPQHRSDELQLRATSCATRSCSNSSACRTPGRSGKANSKQRSIDHLQASCWNWAKASPSSPGSNA